jgi:hypothetical protein
VIPPPFREGKEPFHGGIQREVVTDVEGPSAEHDVVREGVREARPDAHVAADPEQKICAERERRFVLVAVVRALNPRQFPSHRRCFEPIPHATRPSLGSAVTSGGR